MQYNYQTRGVCSKQMVFTIEDGILTELEFDGGCAGNLRGISRLVQGMPVDEVIARLSGLSCGEKATSCPDQLARALRRALGR